MRNDGFPAGAESHFLHTWFAVTPRCVESDLFPQEIATQVRNDGIPGAESHFLQTWFALTPPFVSRESVDSSLFPQKMTIPMRKSMFYRDKASLSTNMFVRMRPHLISRSKSR